MKRKYAIANRPPSEIWKLVFTFLFGLHCDFGGVFMMLRDLQLVSKQLRECAVSCLRYIHVEWKPGFPADSVFWKYTQKLSAFSSDVEGQHTLSHLKVFACASEESLHNLHAPFLYKLKVAVHCRNSVIALFPQLRELSIEIAGDWCLSGSVVPALEHLKIRSWTQMLNITLTSIPLQTLRFGSMFSFGVLDCADLPHLTEIQCSEESNPVKFDQVIFRSCCKLTHCTIRCKEFDLLQNVNWSGLDYYDGYYLPNIDFRNATILHFHGPHATLEWSHLTKLESLYCQIDNLILHKLPPCIKKLILIFSAATSTDFADLTRLTQLHTLQLCSVPVYSSQAHLFNFSTILNVPTLEHVHVDWKLQTQEVIQVLKAFNRATTGR